MGWVDNLNRKVARSTFGKWFQLEGSGHVSCKVGICLTGTFLPRGRQPNGSAIWIQPHVATIHPPAQRGRSERPRMVQSITTLC